MTVYERNADRGAGRPGTSARVASRVRRSASHNRSLTITLTRATCQPHRRVQSPTRSATQTRADTGV